MFGKINKNKSVEGNIKGNSLVPWLRHVCILRTHVREEKAAAMLLRIGVHRCVHPRQDGGRSWPETDSSWTHQYYSVQERYTPKGTMEKGGSNTQDQRKSFTRETERGVHRWLPPSHKQTAGREFTTKKKRLAKKEKGEGKERERERGREGFLLFRARRCLIRLTAKQPRRGLIKKGMSWFDYCISDSRACTRCVVNFRLSRYLPGIVPRVGY